MEDTRTFAVWEGHINDLMKKLHTIERKAQKYGCPISYKQVGETTKEIPTGEVDPVTGKSTFVTCKFALIQAEGTAVINDWEFVATVEHTQKGNIFSKALTDVEIPVRYRTTPCTCEHCNTKRIRSNTFIIRNTKTGDFKQIGRSCLKDYTGGLSAETAVWYASLKNVFEEYREPSLGGSSWYQRFYDTEEFLRYTAETIRHFGYRKSDTEQTTKGMVQDFFDLTHGNTRYWTTEDKDRVREQMVRVGFNADSLEASQMVREALEWLDGQKDTNDYLHNLKTVTALPTNHSGRFGLLVSLFPTWNRDLEIQAERRKELEAGKASVFVGEVGDKITIEAVKVRCITSWENCFGYYPITTYLWEIIGKDGNVYIWKTSKELDTDADHITLKGSVKDHREFRGVKQTEVTRCRVQGVAWPPLG